MGPAEFSAFHAQLRAINTVVDGVDEGDLERFIAACQHADTFGPFLDPTAWMRGRRLSELDRMFEAADDYELAVVEAVAQKAGLVWICPVEPWTNRAGERCGKCSRTWVEAMAAVEQAKAQ